jgi:hypothetical protein
MNSASMLLERIADQVNASEMGSRGGLGSKSHRRSDSDVDEDEAQGSNSQKLQRVHSDGSVAIAGDTPHRRADAVSPKADEGVQSIHSDSLPDLAPHSSDWRPVSDRDDMNDGVSGPQVGEPVAPVLPSSVVHQEDLDDEAHVGVETLLDEVDVPVPASSKLKGKCRDLGDDGHSSGDDVPELCATPDYISQ